MSLTIIRLSVTIRLAMRTMVSIKICRIGAVEIRLECFRSGLRQKIQKRRSFRSVLEHEYGSAGLLTERRVHGRGV